MLDFKEELAKFEPVLEIEEIENAIHSSELQDVLDIMQHVSVHKAYGKKMGMNDFEDKE